MYEELIQVNEWKMGLGDKWINYEERNRLLYVTNIQLSKKEMKIWTKYNFSFVFHCLSQQPEKDLSFSYQKSASLVMVRERRDITEQGLYVLLV